MSTDLEQRFHTRLVNSYSEVGRSTGYWAHRFRQKVLSVGGLQAARDWLARKDHPSGLDRVISVGRPDLALEAIVLEDPWDQLFTPGERAIARRRLEEAIARHRSAEPPTGGRPDARDAPGPRLDLIWKDRPSSGFIASGPLRPAAGRIS